MGGWGQGVRPCVGQGEMHVGLRRVAGVWEKWRGLMWGRGCVRAGGTNWIEEKVPLTLLCKQLLKPMLHTRSVPAEFLAAEDVKVPPGVAESHHSHQHEHRRTCHDSEDGAAAPIALARGGACSATPRCLPRAGCST